MIDDFQSWRRVVISTVALGHELESDDRIAASPSAGSATGAVTVVVSGESVQDQEDERANARAVSAVLLAAHSRGLAGYRRSPEVLRTSGGFEALGLPPDERFVALIHLGRSRQEKQPRDRLC